MRAIDIVIVVFLVVIVYTIIRSSYDDRTTRKPETGPPESAFGRCYHCKISWKYGKRHVTMYTDHEGCFPLCEGCWQRLGTGQKRLKYYKKLSDQNLQAAKDYGLEDLCEQIVQKWPLIERAVLDGK